MSDAFLVTAQTDAGPTCFFLPRILPDGTSNAFYIQRLKDKLGNRSNASAEVEFTDAYAFLVGEPGRGIATIAQMVNSTRLDCIIGSAGLMRAALAQALHHASHRETFGKLLIDHPLMQNVLADLALESEAANLIFLRLAHATDAHEHALKRIGTALGKYWVCKRAPVAIGEALEALGGNGYVEESVLPRLYREAPVNSIWEGSGNINALDVLRILRKEPEALAALEADIGESIAQRVAVDPRDAERDARRLVEGLALVWQASLMQRYAPGVIAEAFMRSRVYGERGYAFGTLPRGVDLIAILERAWP
jgi:putative acyl-CoA dehydrogenase